MIDNIFIQYGKFIEDTPFTRRGDRYIPMPLKLKRTLSDAYDRFGDVVEFTYGHDVDNHIEALAIVHPKDQFSRKIGRTIVVGRIKRMREAHKPYPKPYPSWIYKLER